MQQKQANNDNKFFAFLQKDISLFGKYYKDQKKVELFTELNILLSSGIDIRTSLDIIIANQAKEQDKEVFKQIRTQIVAGKSLSEAIENSGKFTNYDTICMKIGEETGRFNEILSEISQFYTFKIKHKKQLYSSLSYPLMVLATSIVAVIFMMNFIVPMFSEVFKRFGGELPALTRTIIDISDFFQTYIFLILLIIVIIGVLIMYNRKKTWYRKYSAEILMKMPLFGKVVNKIYLSRFCQSMGLLLASKVPMIRSIELVKQMIGFYPYEVALDEIGKDILKGKQLHESLAKFPIFELKVVSLVKVAEEVNQLDTMFARLNKQYSEEVESSIGMLTTFLEPVLIIFVGVLVSVILVSMYLPMFQMSTNIK
jgi:type IV pilus assembly protein PilC